MKSSPAKAMVHHFIQCHRNELSRALLEPFGAEVSEAGSGREGLAMASALPVDVIMLDMRMPEMDGPEILARLRSGAGPNQYVPVLAFTAEAELFSTYLAHGFDGVVAKPINPSDTVQAIRAAIMGEFEERARAEG